MKKLITTLSLFILSFVVLGQDRKHKPKPKVEPQIVTISVPAQKNLTDSDFSDTINLTEGTFPSKRIVGKVVGVHDGDTATILDKDKTQYKFRFNGIDAPELKMDYGNKSKQHLSDLIFGKEVTIVYNKVDKYGRFVGTIFINGVDANLEQIKAGYAWHYKKYADEQTERDRKVYSDTEIKARAANLGVWLQPNPTPPWDFRGEKKAAQETEKAIREYLTGSRGGCYYLNSSGNKTYVNKKYCSAPGKN